MALKEIEIRQKRTVMVFIFLIALYFTYRFFSNIYSTFTDGIGFSIGAAFGFIIDLTLAALSGVLTVYAFKRLTNKGPGLIINSMGIVDNSGLVSAGAVFWVDMEDINTSKVFLSECIIIRVKNPQRYIRNQKNVFKRFWLSMENRYTGSPVNISVNGLQGSFNDLFRIVQQHYLSSHVESRTYELKREKDVIQSEKKELLDSINYAKRIQTALLPASDMIFNQLGENFILFIPKDIVSGDFYWVESVDDWVFFAACDCTGHGVPGALISIVCNNALNRSVKEYGLRNPAHILDKTSELVIESIGVGGEVRDGMDASLCAFNKITRKLVWSGANIPLWMARENTFYELIEFRPDKQPVGLVENRFPYTSHEIEIQKGDLLYLFSDGYADQFGGANGKKLMRKKFKELVLMQRNVPLDKQLDNFRNFHLDYKGHVDQIDDILVMGIKVEK